ncbi:DinB family protein [Paenibacillus sp. GCM10027626]|uniref:DinB family protein n=1 Tax=Paenibacillus sp. GCM10027626 TaxID=3273411 RepID=UPI003643BEDC
MSEIIIHTAQTLRQIVLQQVQAIPEELYDIKPDAFNNTIRWNVGHIVFWMDAYMSLCFQMESAIPASFKAFFDSGTKPSDWTEAPPSKEELIGELTRQMGLFDKIDPHSLKNPLTPPQQFGPFTFNLAGELFNFGLIHEGLHLSTCGSLLKVIKAER